MDVDFAGLQAAQAADLQTRFAAAQQLRFREGYEPREVDRHDITLLRHLVGSCPVTE